MDVLMAPIALVLIVTLAWKWRMAAVSAALVGILARTRELPLSNVDYVAAETEIEARDAGAIHARLRSGERIVIAAFADREHALFVAIVGIVREPLAIVPNPYR